MFVIVVMIIVMVIVAIMVVVAVLAADVMTMDPMVAVLGPMTGGPSHFPIVVPITGTVAVIRPITQFDSEFLRPDGSRESKAHCDNRDEQECFLNHNV
jgi:hypothetical protein